MDEKRTWGDWIGDAAYFIVLLVVGIAFIGPNMILDTLFGTSWVFVASGLLILAALALWFFDRYTIRRRT